MVKAEINKIRLKFDSAIPLYYQLKERIREQVEEEIWRVGDSIPTEQQLQEKYEISRSTVRQAINELVNEGYLVKKQGKGTFVSAARKLREDLPKLHSFTEEMLAKGLKPQAKIISIKEILPSKRIAEALHLEEGEKVMRIERLRSANEEIICILISYLPSSLRIKLEDDFTGSLYDLLETKYEIPIVKGDQLIEASAANKYEAGLLGVRRGFPVLCMTRVTYTTSNKPIELVEGIYRADRYKYGITLKR